MRDIIASAAPHIEVTLSHQINPVDSRVPPCLGRVHRRFAEAADVALHGRAAAATARRGLHRTAAGRQRRRRPARARVAGRRADSLDQLGTGARPRGRAPSRRGRDGYGQRGDRRRWRHELRRERGARRADPAHARDVARRPVRRAHHRLSLGRRTYDRCGRRQHRQRRRGRPAVGGSDQRRLGPGSGVLRARRHAPDGDRRGHRARLPRCRPLGLAGDRRRRRARGPGDRRADRAPARPQPR